VNITKTWTQDDRLKELIDWDAIMPMPRYAGGHDEQMQGLIKGASVLSHWNEGDYSGSVATALLLADGRVAMYNDYYGSCSGCDSWEDATDSDVRKLCEGLANGAYVFPDEASAKALLQAVITEANGNEYRSVSTEVGFQWQPKEASGLLGKWGKK